MAKISEYIDAGTLDGTERVPLSRMDSSGGETFSTSTQDIADLVVAGGGAYYPGGFDVAIGDGGTGASTASAARTNLGLAIGMDVQAYNARLADLAGITYAQGDILYFNGASLVKLAAGISGQFLKTLGAGADPQWAAPGGGGLTNWTEDVNSSSPNTSTPVVSFTPNNAASNVDVALIPKANGALLAVIPNGSSTGGDKRGTQAVDWQMNRSAAAQVASGSRAVICGGSANKANNSYAFIGGGSTNTAGGINSGVSCGDSNTASSNYSYVGGGRNNTASGPDSVICGGYNNTVSGQWAAGGGGRDNSIDGLACFGIGWASKTLNDYSANFSAGYFAAIGDAQEIRMVLRCNTTDATQTALTANQAAQATGNQLTLENNSAMTVKGLVVARQNSTGDTATWEFTAAIKRGANAAATSMVGTCTPTQPAVDSGASTWALSVTADITRGALQVKFTGEASKTIRAVCTLTATYIQG